MIKSSQQSSQYEKMEMNQQDKIFQAMAQPDFYDHPVNLVEQRETHISKVFLAGDYVYKIKKPLNLEFLDYTTLAKRKYYCRQEIMLNRRLSDDIYLEVVAITSDRGRYYLSSSGKPVEYAVKMSRLADDCSMIRLLRRGKIDRTAIDGLAQKLVEFYKQSATGETINTFSSWEAIRANCEDNFRQAEVFVEKLLDRRVFQIIRAATRSFLQRKKTLFQHRIDTQKIRDCHGDLRTGHIYFINGIQIIDCIEFNDRFRYLDIASDLAFLAMDLDFEGFPEIAWNFLDTYVKLTHDPDVFVLIDFYKCQRAIVRAKVNCLHLAHKELGGRSKNKFKREIDRYMDLAYHYAVRFTRPTLWVVCGLPASGKSTISNALAGSLNAKVLRSDLIRRELFGLDAGTSVVVPFKKGIYSKQAGSLTYGKLLLLAQEEIEKGESVILDATFSGAHQRREALRLAQDQDANILFIECVSPSRLLKARLMRRATEYSISDARLQHLEAFRKIFEPLSELHDETHIRIDTQKPLEENIREILSLLI